MKNFSDITDIETVGALAVELEYQLHGRCVACVQLNGQDIGSSKSLVMVNLLDPITLKINLLEFNEGTSGLEIIKFAVNGLEVLPKYQHLANKSTNYIDFYDKWCMEIPTPFYVWYHKITGQGWIA